MTEELVKKEYVCAGHRASVSRMVKKSEELFAADTLDTTKLAQLKMSLKEKLEVLSWLDGEILSLVEEEASITKEIQQSDGVKEGTYAILVRIDSLSRIPPASTTPLCDGVQAEAGGTSHVMALLSCPNLPSNPSRVILQLEKLFGTPTRQQSMRTAHSQLSSTSSIIFGHCYKGQPLRPCWDSHSQHRTTRKLSPCWKNDSGISNKLLRNTWMYC